MLRATSVLLATLLAAGCAGLGADDRPPLPDRVYGPARVIDGDTIEVEGVRVRLFGIDADERGSTAGKIASGMLVLIVRDRPVECVKEDVDRYGRLVATCWVKGEQATVDVAAQMVAEGYATAYRRFSDRYAGHEADARGRQAGLHGAMQLPALF